MAGWDLAQQLWQHGSFSGIAGRGFDRARLQRFLVDPYMCIAPNAAFGAAMLARSPGNSTLCCLLIRLTPFAFALGFYACAINKKGQQDGAATIQKVHVQRSLASLGRFAMQIACLAAGRHSVLKSGTA
ncbi:hypothetical protein METH_20760 [Leisingera methylohalidivorans DSM 14336]|uniref:Uncharacterized protein n=1 Tax=Leisingera methylohalidivorans DSM 14336 TaxID=999552 RepID=V9VZF3_9RHOB|nr:hypothetical protein METH_20760 [Leisingera methylohalidivorans DSM 14336]